MMMIWWLAWDLALYRSSCRLLPAGHPTCANDRFVLEIWAIYVIWLTGPWSKPYSMDRTAWDLVEIRDMNDERVIWYHRSRYISLWYMQDFICETVRWALSSELWAMTLKSDYSFEIWRFWPWYIRLHTSWPGQISVRPNWDTKCLHSGDISALQSRRTMCKMSPINLCRTFLFEIAWASITSGAAVADPVSVPSSHLERDCGGYTLLDAIGASSDRRALGAGPHTFFAKIA